MVIHGSMGEIDVDGLSRFVERTNSILSRNPRMNEPNTKAKVIQPLLEILEWDFYKDIQLEYPVRVGTSTARVDYALMIDNEPVLLIEAKGFDTDLSDKEAHQAISYGRYEGVKWVAVTNGKSLWLFNSEWGKEPENCIIAKLSLDDYLNKKELLWLLSKQYIEEGKTDDIVEVIHKSRQCIDAVEQNKDDIVDNIESTFRRYADSALYDSIREFSKSVVPKFIENMKEPLSDVMQSVSPKEEGREFVRRQNLPGNPQDEVAVFPSREDGIEFLEKYNAWGYVKMSRRPRFLALYVTAPYSSVLYLGEIKKVAGPFQNKNEIKKIEAADKTTFEPGKQLIYLKKGSVKKLSDPIPAGGVGTHPQGLRYTTIGKMMYAEDTSDLW